MLFKEIPGNFLIKNQLIASVKKNRISHAQLFTGNSGSAKLALAFAYARYINCEDKLSEDSCGKCSPCIKYNSLSHSDLHLIFPVLKLGGAKSAISDDFINLWREWVLNNVYFSLNDWIDFFSSENKAGNTGAIYKDEANALRKKLSLKNFESQYRVVLIWMPETMNAETSNKLLKLLEEPPFGTVFLLVSESPKKLMPTVYSRLQQTRVNNFSADDMVEFFKTENISAEKIDILRHITGSDLGKMIQLLREDGEEKTLFADFTLWMRAAYKVDILKISSWLDSISVMGRKYQKIFLSYVIKMVRECLVFNFADKSLLRASEKELVFISKFAPFINGDNSVLIVEELEKAIQSINRNANSKILLFDLSLKMAKFLKVKRKFAIE
tara:strand:+ start:701 stop:1852 length:1152 start_codon:yes stop_codon:yes gene_type:complete